MFFLLILGAQRTNFWISDLVFPCFSNPPCTSKWPCCSWHLVLKPWSKPAWLWSLQMCIGMSSARKTATCTRDNAPEGTELRRCRHLQTASTCFKLLTWLKDSNQKTCPSQPCVHAAQSLKDRAEVPPQVLPRNARCDTAHVFQEKEIIACWSRQHVGFWSGLAPKYVRTLTKHWFRSYMVMCMCKTWNHVQIWTEMRRWSDGLLCCEAKLLSVVHVPCIMKMKRTRQSQDFWLQVKCCLCVIKILLWSASASTTCQSWDPTDVRVVYEQVLVFCSSCHDACCSRALWSCWKLFNASNPAIPF